MDKIFNNNTKIYCDMDGVVADFASAAIDKLNDILEQGEGHHLFSYSKKAKDAYNKIVEDPELGENWRAEKPSDLDNKKIKSLLMTYISQNPGKWFDELDPLNDGIRDLWNYITSIGPKVYMLTAGVSGKSDSTTSEEGKRSWVEKHLDPKPQDVIMCPAAEKHKYALNDDGSANILIDDKGSTIESWNNAGGFGILHHPGKSANTIKKLNDIKNNLNINKTAILKRIRRKIKDSKKSERMEWALVSKRNPKKILRWFGPTKPSKKMLAKEERRIHSFGSINKGDNMIGDLIRLANHLDSIGFSKEAGFLDEVIKEAAKKEDKTKSSQKPKPSKKQIEVFDVDGDGKPFEEEDFKMLKEKKKKSAAQITDINIVKELVLLANSLDSKGFSKEASYVDSLLKVAQQDKATVVVNYQVGRGDSWSSITKNWSPGRTPEENAKLNGMTTSDVLKACQMIKIYSLPEAEGLANNPGCM